MSEEGSEANSETTSDLTGAPPPTVDPWLQRAAGWALLVWGCALPLLVVTWRGTPRAGRVGELCGVVVWTVVVIWHAERLRRAGANRRLRMLRVGMIALLVGQGFAALFREALVFFIAYSPSVWLVAQLSLIPDFASAYYGHMLLTLACGAQAFGGAWLLGWAVVKMRPR